MADERGRKLQRAAAQGDGNAAIALAQHGARTQDDNLIFDGIVGALSILSEKQLNSLMRKIAEKLDEKQYESKDPAEEFNTTKACQIHMPDIGKITTARFIAMVHQVVEDCISGNADSNPNIDDFQGYVQERVGNRWVYSTRTYNPRRNKSAMAKKAEKAFEDFSGDFVISCSSPIRIYALKKKPTAEELERRRVEKQQREIEARMERRRKALEEAQEKQKKLREELAKLEQREKRIKSNMEKMDNETSA